MLALCTEVGNDGMQVDAASVPEKKVEIEAASAVLVNPSRVLPPQEKHIKLAEGSRYVPVKHKYTTRPILSGFVLLKDLQPAEAEVLALTDAPSGSAAAAVTPMPMRSLRASSCSIWIRRPKFQADSVIVTDSSRVSMWRLTWIPRRRGRPREYTLA